MYANGYSLWEWGYQVPLEALKGTNIPAAINGESALVLVLTHRLQAFSHAPSSLLLLCTPFPPLLC